MGGEELLKRRVAEVGCSQVAAELTAFCAKKISRPAVSLAVAGKYPGDPKHIFKRAEECYGQCDCPFLATRISHAECHAFSHRPMPTDAMGEAKDAEDLEKAKRDIRHWRACRSCDLRQEQDGGRGGRDGK